jgi:Tol biopolymer transport system component
LDLSWSPDGRFLAYVDASDYTAEITQVWLVRTSDGEAVPVTDGMTNDWSPTWSSDGRTLFFISNRGGAMDLWAQTLGDDGRPDRPPEAMTTGIGMRHAEFSSDGTKLAYSRGRLVANLWRVPLLESRRASWADARQLTFDQAFIEFADVSPDGKRLLVSSDRGGNQDLWIVAVEGGEMKQLATDRTPDWRPSWSPDGKEIAFYGYRSGNREIWVMPAGGGPARQITRHEAQDYFPSWSPDGREIAFVSLRSGNIDVWVVSAEGGEPRQITSDPGSDNFPRWSPDGKWLVFRSSRDGVPRLWRVPAGGGEPERFTQGAANFFRWSPDGKRIYFFGAGERSGDVWVRSLSDGTERPLTDLSGRPGTLGLFGLATDGKYIYFTWQEDLGDIWVMDALYE